MSEIRNVSMVLVLLEILFQTAFWSEAKGEEIQLAKTIGFGLMCGIKGWVPKTGIRPDELPDSKSEEAQLYAKYCSQCHPL